MTTTGLALKCKADRHIYLVSGDAQHSRKLKIFSLLCLFSWTDRPVPILSPCFFNGDHPSKFKTILGHVQFCLCCLAELFFGERAGLTFNNKFLQPLKTALTFFRRLVIERLFVGRHFGFIGIQGLSPSNGNSASLKPLILNHQNISRFRLEGARRPLSRLLHLRWFSLGKSV